MDLQNRTELEDLVKYDADCSPCGATEEFVEHAVSVLHAHEKWLTENRAQKAET
jgi:hypothetical protein